MQWGLYNRSALSQALSDGKCDFIWEALAAYKTSMACLKREYISTPVKSMEKGYNNCAKPRSTTALPLAYTVNARENTSKING